MARIESWFEQDLKKPVKVQTLNGSVFTLDNVGSLIGVEVYSDGEAVTLTGTVTGYIILPDETTVSVAGTRSGNTAYIALPQSALAYPGFIRIAIKLTNSSEITTLLAVVATVYKSRTDTIITPSQQIITDWSQQIAAEMQAVEDASAAQDAKIDYLNSTLIPFPVYPDSKYGTSGQNLRTLGNGKTQWVYSGLPTDEQTAEAVSAWLDAHPEATTTVQDGSLTETKFTNELKLKAIKDYVTPQMFGAVGDGNTDDTDSFINALANASVVLIPSGKYKITRQIEITNKHRLLAIGNCIIYTYVSSTYAFWIHGETGSDYEQTNRNYDTYKGVWFGGSDGGITIINALEQKQKGILFGIDGVPTDELYGMNAVSQIANVGIINYSIGIKITGTNNYLNEFNRVQFERCTNDVEFGVTGKARRNSGELFKFISCIFSTSEIAIQFITMGWEVSLENCSIDFVTIGFKDTDYNKVYFINGHIEGVGNRSGSALEYGILIGEGVHSLYTFTNVIFDISYPSRGTTMFKGNGHLSIANSYESTAVEKSVISGEYFLSEQHVILLGTFLGQEGYRHFLSDKNNLVPDALLSKATIDDTGTTVTDGIKIGYKHGLTNKIVQGSMFQNQKSIRFTGNNVTQVTGAVEVIIPVNPNKTYNVGMAMLKNTSKTVSRAVGAIFYDKDNTQIGILTGYMVTPNQPESGEVYFPYQGRLITTPAGTAYMKLNFSVFCNPDSVTLDTTEYIDIEYMYVEEYD